MKSQRLLQDKAKRIRCLICDVDGVLSDGYISLDENGVESKRFHVHDGMGLKFLMAAGIEVAVITTSREKLLSARMAQLCIPHVFYGQRDKRHAYDSLKKRLQLDDDAFAYIGDDLPDIAILKQVGLAITVNGAQDALLPFIDLQTVKPGGFGAVREVCNFLLEAQDKTDLALCQYLSNEQ